MISINRQFIGVMSGTSMDSVDVALCEIDEKRCTLMASFEYPFSTELKQECLKLISNGGTLKEIGQIDIKLALLFSDAINEMIKENNINREDIEAIGLHGQTLWHEPNSPYPFSMQLGNPNVVTTQTKIKVVADFRQKDVALGGQGAPFAPVFHHFAFNHLEPCGVVNIGGMANITILKEDKIIGFDTGCGNVLMDLWISKHQNKSYDKDGSWAKGGALHHELLKSFLSDEYFLKEYPKSTGREYFNLEWIEHHLQKFKPIKPQDVQRTLLFLTANSITLEAKKFKMQTLLLCGGGAKNSFFVQTLQALLPACHIQDTTKHGVDSDFLEAMIFAWLAYKRVNRQSVALKDVTGASKNAILGGVFESE
jgi:anhydro-N-acetylmuramic acid kinase